ncbi:MAG: endopeptidase La [Clostridia bacterium]|nr:endopeptidase La [Clostridia bacterium]
MENKLHFIPVVPMRGVMVFPGMNLNFDAGREMSIKGLANASEENSLVFLVAQKDVEKEKPKLEDLYNIGTIARINQVMHLPGNITRVVVTGIKRGVIRELTASKPFIKAVVEEFDDVLPDNHIVNEAYVRRVRKGYEEYFAMNSKLSADNFMALMTTNNLGKACDMIAGSVDFSLEKKQALLEEFDVYERAEMLIKNISEQIEVLKVEQKIAKKVKENIDRNQREYYLREQLKVISEELGDRDGINEDVEDFTNRIKKARMGKANTEKLLKEVNRFAKMQPSSAESSVLRSYIETVLEMPWNKATKEVFDIEDAREILDEDHYGLEKVKERVLEYLAVRQFTNGKNGTILCLSGPPGVGKTSVAKSIARALGRKYVRISLGGIHDEADIRGHRKTYIGAMEGRIMAAMKEVKVNNPLVLLDEIDKMGVDYKGDPSAALLEVLDVEQNSAFRDHYLEVEFDLSKVLFVTTANTLDTVSRPLLDRMEIIELSGYTDEEKFNIAKEYLVKKALEKTGLTSKQVSITDDAIKSITEHYTREAGVRKLEQQIEALCRKAAKTILDKNRKSIKITSKNISDYLGKERYNFDMKNEKDEVGIARGLAWTSVGGDTLSIETNVMSGSGKIELTGKLGDVMKESAMAAISYIRSRAEELNIDKEFYSTSDIHIHVPEGAVPKDGPSAGITMATALVSALTGKPVRNDIAMTGEITLRGRVLPIGGLKEKSMAAYRAGITTVIIPEKNKADIDDVPQEIRKKMKFIPVSHMDTVLENALR